MKLIKSVLAGSLLLLGLNAAQAAQPQYFGYYFNSGQLAENGDHINIHFIQSVSINSQPDAVAYILSELAQAKSRNVKAIVDVHKILFHSSATDGCPYTANPVASAHWNDFASKLVSQGYLVPNDPANSTVVAFYPVDEPELCGLSDQKPPGSWAFDMHPALSNALAAIRSNPSTSSVPVSVTVHREYSTVSWALLHFDWIGLDNYGANDDAYLRDIANLKSKLDLSRQRVVLVPQAAINGSGLDNFPHTPQRMYDAARSDPSVVMLMPFLWNHPKATGLRSIPWLRPDYERIGKEIKNPQPAPTLPQPTQCGFMNPGEGLASNTMLNSCDGRFHLVMQGDGNLVLYNAAWTALWNSGSNGHGASTALLQGDGNFVVYAANSYFTWNSSTGGQSISGLWLQNDGNVVIYSTAGQALWNTQTGGH